MKRRDFIKLLGGVAGGWSLNARAQQMPLIGFLGSSSRTETDRYLSSFSQGMREFGFAEGRSYSIEQRYPDGNLSLLPRLAKDLVSLDPKVIVADSTPGALAAKQATSSIAIVGLNMTDPVGLGLVASEAHPGTNVTGTLIRVEGLAGKLLEIALDLEPGVDKVGALVNSSNPSNVIQRREAMSAAAKLGVNFAPVEVRSADEIRPAFQTLEHDGAKVIIVFTDAILITARRQIAALALASHLPTVSGRRDLVEDGGLISYGISQRDTYHRAAYYVDRILKGEKPRDLPIEFSTKLELVINVTTAKAIGLNISPTLLATADDVIK